MTQPDTTTDFRQILRQCAAETMDPSRMRGCGLHDYLTHDCLKTNSPHEFAIHALTYFCIDDGRFNGFLQGVLTVLLFLTRSTKVSGNRQGTEALHDIMIHPPIRNIALLDWAKSWYS